ncbi:Putative sulfatase AslA [Durusdinium trenchii]|uniref:Sulfatase AslA n=1 Tax=Durusdinium trenchii TaxID=1381693 RepID=A0ABP0M1V2_9DINO
MMVSKTHDADEQIVLDREGMEVYQERVDTARLTERLRVARWADDTGEVVDGLSYFPLLQVHFDLKWEAADPETHRAHEQQREALRARAHAADSQHDTSEELRLIDEHGQECPFYADMIGTTGEAFPVWLGYLPYAVACFLFLSWPYRYFLSQHAVKGDFVFEKRSLAEKFENAVRALQEAQKEKVSAIQAANDQAWEINKEAKEIDESRAKKEMRLTLMKESSKITDTSCQEFRTLPLREKPRSPWLVLKRNALDKDLEDLNAQNRHAQQEVTTHQKQFERMKRRYRQSLSHKDSVLETLPPLEVNKKELEKTTKLQEEDIRRQGKLLEDIQAEVDLFIGAFLKQESLEKDKKEEFEAIKQQMDEMQKEIKNLKTEVQEQLSRSAMPFIAVLLTLLQFLEPGAVQFDAYFEEAQAKNNVSWTKEDSQINEKLKVLEAKFKKKPNIIYILSDDIGFGELGWQGGGKHRGTPGPGLDAMAYAGMRFWSSYSEPSCTPSRVAIMTGRHPVRTGLTTVLWPGQTDGLSPDEVTLPEVLGEEPEHAPENQGFEYAYYGLFNGAPDLWPDAYDLVAAPNSNPPTFLDFPGIEAYKEDTGIDLSVSAYVGRKEKGRKPIEGLAGKPGPQRQEAFEEESINQILKYVKEKANDVKPFFIYWATYAQQLSGVTSHANEKHVDHVNSQASMMAAHSSYVTQLLQTLKDEKIAENTLVVWISDNGPMYAFYPNSGYSWLKGGKGSVWEGGVRTPAMAWWPGMIEANQDPVDLLQITDLYTTAARLGGALEHIPNDRVTDGLDQAALLLLGEGHGRRKKIFHYSGDHLGALRRGDFKAHFVGGASGGLPKMEAYNVRRDPGEKYGEFYPYLWLVTPIQKDVKAHKRMMQKFPNRGSEGQTSCAK